MTSYERLFPLAKKKVPIGQCSRPIIYSCGTHLMFGIDLRTVTGLHNENKYLSFLKYV
jgi:hypothetical protein